jgi:hypothetical protein
MADLRLRVGNITAMAREVTVAVEDARVTAIDNPPVFGA